MSLTFENEVKSWLTVVLKKENLKDLSVKILGNSEKGDGYLSDIVFVQASGFRDGSLQEYKMALKCTKRESVIRDTRLKDTFVNEIFVYDELLPTLIQFQKEKGLDRIFDNVPKCYGTLTEGAMQVIVLENLKQSGYELWPRKEPLARNHIDVVLEAYAQLHAASAAFEIQHPEKFQQIRKTLENNLKSFFDPSNDMSFLFTSSIEYAAEVLQDDLDNNVLLKWRQLEGKVKSISENARNYQGFKVLLHGDSWNNNFMYKYKIDDKKPSEVVIIDWQVARYGPPVSELSYFLCACISKEDIENIDEILGFYYKHFSSHLEKLGVSDPNMLYPFEQLMKDWDRICVYGIMLASLLTKICLADKDDIVAAEIAGDGKKFGENFVQKVQDTEAYKNKMKHIVEYAHKKGFLD